MVGRILLDCFAESNNPLDPYAVIVKCPPLWEIPKELRDSQTCGPPESSSPVQTVRMVAGQVVGRVPRSEQSLASAIRGDAPPRRKRKRRRLERRILALKQNLQQRICMIMSIGDEGARSEASAYT